MARYFVSAARGLFTDGQQRAQGDVLEDPDGASLLVRRGLITALPEGDTRSSSRSSIDKKQKEDTVSKKEETPPETNDRFGDTDETMRRVDPGLDNPDPNPTPGTPDRPIGEVSPRTGPGGPDEDKDEAQMGGAADNPGVELEEAGNPAPSDKKKK